MALRRRSWNAILILLLIGMACAQAATLNESHSSNHADHCCPVCHAGHVSVLQPVNGTAVAPLALLCWHQPAVQNARLIESQLVLDHSRGPPA